MNFSLFRKLDNNDGPITLPLPGILNSGLAVYFNAGANPPTIENIVHIATEWLSRRADPKLRDAIGSFIHSPMVMLDVRTKEQIPLPPMQMLHAMRLGEMEERRLVTATHAVMIGVHDVQKFPQFGLIAALAVARALATELKGVILDPQCGRILRIDTYDEHLPENPWLPLSKQIVVPHSVDQRGVGWMTTVGMDKYGLPNLEVRDLPPNVGEDFVPIVCGVAQRLIWEVFRKNKDTREPATSLTIGPELRVSTRDMDLAYGETPDETDGRPAKDTGIWLGYYPATKGEKFLGIMPGPKLRKQPGVWVYQCLQDLFGTRDEMGAVSKDSESMEIAHRRAVDELPGVKIRYERGLPLGSSLFVKHGFPTTSGDREYMWIAVQTWHGSRIAGILANDPHDVPKLRSGDTVQINESDVFDWMIGHKDGRREGGYTTQVVQSEGITRR